MRRRLLAGALLAAGSLMTTGCGPVSPIGGPDRSEEVAVPGGTCQINWWLSPAVNDPPAEAQRVAEEALESATVSETQWSDWYRILDDDPDLDSIPEIRLRGSAYLEAVRDDVRTALDRAGYPDMDRSIEVYSNLSCA